MGALRHWRYQVESWLPGQTRLRLATIWIPGCGLKLSGAGLPGRLLGELDPKALTIIPIDPDQPTQHGWETPMRGFLAARAAAAAFAGATVAALAGAGSALASTPTPVTIEVITSSPGAGTFTASGAGLCPSGTTADQSFGTGGQSGFLANFHDLKTFTCADGSGTFTANVQAHLIFGAPTDSFTWNIVGGTGAYANLHGSGNGVGDELPTEIDDHFAGAVFFS